MGIDYHAVNKFMTNWKRKEGILKKKTRKVAEYTGPAKQTELEFLRNFYLNSVL